MVNKKGDMFFSMFLLLAIIILLVEAAIIVINERAEFRNEQKKIMEVGDVQIAILNTQQKTELVLLYLDQSALYSSYLSIHGLAEQGGFFKKPKCGDYFGYNLWQTSHLKVGKRMKFRRCYPINYEEEFKKYYDTELYKYLDLLWGVP
jgi:hypothetical protein